MFLWHFLHHILLLWRIVYKEKNWILAQQRAKFELYGCLQMLLLAEIGLFFEGWERSEMESVPLIWHLVFCFFLFCKSGTQTLPLLTPSCPFLFFILKFKFVSLGCCERPERYQRPLALRSPLQIFPPQLRMDFISNPLCIWKVLLPVSSNSKRLPAFIGCLTFGSAPHCVFHEHTRILSSPAVQHTCGNFCENFWDDLHLKPRYTCCQLSWRKQKTLCNNCWKQKTFHSLDCCAGSDRRCDIMTL